MLLYSLVQVFMIRIACTMIRYISFIGALATCFCCDTWNFSSKSHCSMKCEVRARIHSGWICGRIRDAEDNVKYASFRGIPYAQQPVGELRFKELQPVKPWDHVLDATEEGPICPQYDQVYGRLAKPSGMSESCIFVNVHVPLKHYRSPFNQCQRNNLRIVVFIHGGGFQVGSGNTDLHGPEYLVSQNVIVITFNHRLNVFGYLSLNTSKVPGNNALRDMVTLLRWVQKNACAFGGDPDNVTLAGHSCGAVAAHLLSLSDVSRGLFKRLVLMSGTAVGGFYTPSPVYSKNVADLFIQTLGINSTDPDYIHDQLIKMPLKKIEEANRIVQYKTGVVSFVPVVESKHPGVTRILKDYPENLMNKGRGSNFPIIIGTTSIECVFFKRRILYLNLLKSIKENPTLLVPRSIFYSVSKRHAVDLAQRMMYRYFKGNHVTVDKYIKCCTDTFFKYPALKVAQHRAASGGAPAFVYEYSFDSDYNTVKDALLLQYEGGGGHLEDLTCIFRTNAMLRDEKCFPPRSRDDLMKYRMTMFVVNFMKCSQPICDRPKAWPPVDPKLLSYQKIYDPLIDKNTPMSKEERDMIHFYDCLGTGKHAPPGEVKPQTD